MLFDNGRYGSPDGKHSYGNAHLVAFMAGGAGTLAASVPLILYGTDRWGKWGYILPFLSLPVVLFASGEGSGSWLFLAVPFVVGAGVHAYYRRQAGKTS